MTAANGQRCRVSVCVVTYNQESLIGPCLESVLAQARDADLQVLVGDDCSTDGTAQVVAGYEAAFPGRVTLLRRERNMGAARNYQDLISRANGEFIAHIDGDDMWLPGKLHAQLEFLLAKPSCPAVYTNAMVVDQSGEFLGPFTNRQPSEIDLPFLAARGNFLMHSSILYRRAYAPAILGFAEPFIDYQVHLTLATSAPLGFINACLAVYRQNTAHSMLKHQRSLVQLLTWRSLRSVFPRLSARARMESAAYLVGAMLLAQFRNPTDEFHVVVAEAVQALDCSRARLFRAALVLAVPLWIRDQLRRLVQSLSVATSLAVHPRP